MIATTDQQLSVSPLYSFESFRADAIISLLLQYVVGNNDGRRYVEWLKEG